MQAWLGLLLLALILCVALGGPDWLGQTLGCLFSASFLLFLLNAVTALVWHGFAFTRRVQFANPKAVKGPPRRASRRIVRAGGKRPAVSRKGRRGHVRAWLRRRGVEALALLVIPAGLGVWWFALTRENDLLGITLFLIPLFTAIPLLFWLVKKSQVMKREWLQHRIADAEEAMSRDRRPPVLLLRSFRDEGREAEFLAGPDVPVSLEEALTKPLSRYGPVIAVGRPGDRLPPLGANREYVSGDWRGRVGELIGTAQIIVAMLDDSPGLVWELGRVFELGAETRLVLVVPPATPEKLARRWRLLKERIGDAGSKSLQHDLDSTWSRNLALVFDGKGGVHQIIGRLRLESYYRDAIPLAVEFIRRGAAGSEDPASAMDR